MDDTLSVLSYWKIHRSLQMISCMTFQVIVQKLHNYVTCFRLPKKRALLLRHLLFLVFFYFANKLVSYYF